MQKGQPRLRLYGPDNRFGARKRRGYTQYIWNIEWSNGRGTCSRSTGKVREDHAGAQEAFRDWLAAHAEKPTGSRRPSEMLIADMLAFYAEEHAPQTADPARIAHSIAPLLASFFGEGTADQIKASTCRRYVKDRMAAGIARRTAGRELETLRAAANYCRDEGYLTEAPGFDIPGRGEPRDRWLTREEAAALLRAARNEPKAKGHLPMFILIALYTGRRAKQQILPLQWQPNMTGGWVDLERKLIHWRPIGRRETKKRIGQPTPIPDRLYRFLVYQRQKTRQYVLEIDVSIKKDKARGRKVIRWAGNNRRAFTTACEEAKLEGVTRHTLKHTAITWLMQRGVPIFEVAGFTETSQETIERVYAHHAPDYLEGARTALTSQVHPKSGRHRASPDGKNRQQRRYTA